MYFLTYFLFDMCDNNVFFTKNCFQICAEITCLSNIYIAKRMRCTFNKCQFNVNREIVQSKTKYQEKIEFF